MIIGITGCNCSGKGEVARYLFENGFQYLSLSDCLRNEAKKRNLDTRRETLAKLGNELRKKYGSGILAKRIIKKIKEKNVVIDSIRNIGEVKELKILKNFFLLGVKTPLKLRFLRSIERQRTGDMATLYKFKKQEEEENKEEKTNQQLKKCIKLSDEVILNNGSISDLHKKIGKVLNLWKI